MSARDVLVVGNLRGASRSALTTAVSSLKLDLTEIANVDEAMAALERQPWCAVLIDTTLSGASRFCAEARSNRTLFGIPFIALSPRLTDLAFLNALRWGADDVVALGAAEALTVRLSSLVDAAPPSSPFRERGEAVVADPDRRRANGLGRAIYGAGYGTRYATDTTSARFYTTKPEVELFLLSADLTDPKTLIQEAQAAGCQAKWVVLAKAAQTDELQKELSPFKGVVVLSAGGPPENVLFALNLLYPSEASRRGEIRALFGTVVYFRAVGDYRDECGFCYTASPQGLYVRTLAPPPADKVWVELIPPDGERRVRLVGKLAWSRPYGRQPGEPSPPGFGVRIVDGLGEDLALWSECLRGLDFKAPATLVPEARFSVPSPARPSEPGSPPTAAKTNGRRPLVPEPSDVHSVPEVGASDVSAGEAAQSRDAARTSISPSVPHPPISTSMDRLSAAARARISTRPSLRLSIPGALGVKREALTKPGRLSRPPEAAFEAAPVPSKASSSPERVGQGRTVMGLGILHRDGSLVASPSSVDSPDRISTPPADPAPLQTANSFAPSPDRSSHNPPAEVSRLSPVTGRTLTYGSQPPPADEHKFQAAADVMPYPDDISERPTLADRLSLDRAEQLARQSSWPEQSAPANRETFDSLPPDALESDAPEAPVVSPPARLPGRATKTLLAEPAASEVADTNRNWVGLETIPTEQRLGDEPRSVKHSNAESFSSPEAKEVTPRSVDLGTTLPGMVVDTTLQSPPPAPQSQLETAHRDSPVPRPALVLTTSATARAPRVADVEEPLEINGLPPKRSRSLLPLLAAIAVASAVIAILIKPSPTSHPTTAAPADQAAPSNASAPETPAVAVSAEPAVAPGPTQFDEPPKAVTAPEPPIPAPRAETSAAPAVLPPATGDGPPPKDPGTLPSKNGLLFVQTAIAARVFVHGVDAGPTNSWLETPCGTRFVRLGSAPGEWLSPGMPVIIRCRSANTVEVPTL